VPPWPQPKTATGLVPYFERALVSEFL